MVNVYNNILTSIFINNNLTKYAYCKTYLGATRYFLVPRSIDYRHLTTIHISNYTIYAVTNNNDTSGFKVKFIFTS